MLEKLMPALHVCAIMLTYAGHIISLKYIIAILILTYNSNVVMAWYETNLTDYDMKIEL